MLRGCGGDQIVSIAWFLHRDFYCDYYRLQRCNAQQHKYRVAVAATGLVLLVGGIYGTHVVFVVGVAGDLLAAFVHLATCACVCFWIYSCR